MQRFLSAPGVRGTSQQAARSALDLRPPEAGLATVGDRKDLFDCTLKGAYLEHLIDSRVQAWPQNLGLRIQPETERLEPGSWVIRRYKNAQVTWEGVPWLGDRIGLLFNDLAR